MCTFRKQKQLIALLYLSCLDDWDSNVFPPTVSGYCSIVLPGCRVHEWSPASHQGCVLTKPEAFSRINSPMDELSAVVIS